MSSIRRALSPAALALAASLLAASPLAAQLPDRIIKQGARTGYVNLSGPRVGALFLAGDEDRMRRHHDIDRTLTQVGLALETRSFAVREGPTAVLQLHAYAGFSDEGKVIPNGMALFGLRTQNGIELSVGAWGAERVASPVAQVATVFNAGWMRLPLAVQVMPTSDGARVGFTAGFNAFR